MRTPEAEFTVKSHPFNKKYEYNHFFAGECHGEKEVNTTGFLTQVQQGYQLFEESQVYILASHEKK
jgi:hypothetical protein